MDVLSKVIQSNARFGLSDRLEVHVDYVKMASGNGKGGLKTKGRASNWLSHNKTSIVTVKMEINCLAAALVIAMAGLNRDPNYPSYRDGYKLGKPVAECLRC
jgi:hypothetical protein